MVFPGTNAPPAWLPVFLRRAVGVVVLLAWYYGLNRLVRAGGHLPEECYYRPLLIVELAWHIVSLVARWQVLLVVLVAASVARILWMRYPTLRKAPRRFLGGWEVMEHGGALRLFITFTAFILAWAYATYDYNLYFDQAHYADRLLLMVLVPLIYWRPLFLWPFLLLLVAIITQFDYPLHQATWVEVNLLIDVLVLFAAFCLLHAATGRRSTIDFLLILCCMIAAGYVGSALAKLRLGWLAHSHLPFMLVSTYANGWLAFLEPGAVVALERVMEALRTPLMVFTLVVEGGALLMLWRRFAARLCVGGFILLHLGIMAVSGIFFWKWILLEAGFLAFVLGPRQAVLQPLFSRTSFLLSIVLIGGGKLWFHAYPFAWYETPLTYSYRLEGIGLSGTRYSLPTHTFTPYTDGFVLSNFRYLSPHPEITRGMGVVGNRSVADSLRHIRTPQQAIAFEQRDKTVYFDAALAARYDRFIAQFMGHLNARGSKRTWLSPFQAPPHLCTFPRSGAFPRDSLFMMQEPIARVVVRQVTSFFDGVHYADIRTRTVRVIPVPSSPPERQE